MTQLGYRSMQISGAVREFNTPMFAKSPRCETPNASDQYHSLRQEYQPANIIEFPPTLFDRALHVQCGDVRRKQSSSDPGPWAGEQAAKALGKAVLPEMIRHQCPEGSDAFHKQRRRHYLPLQFESGQHRLFMLINASDQRQIVHAC